MSAFQLKEKSKRAWAFALITLAWLGAAMAVVQHLAPKADTDTALRRAALARNSDVIQEQQMLLNQQDALAKEIKETPFQIYQMYVVAELRDQVNGLHQKNSRVENHSQRISKVLLLLLNAREELVAEQRNLVKIAEQVQNCREGNQDIRMN
jgi:hypothetical protein